MMERWFKRRRPPSNEFTRPGATATASPLYDAEDVHDNETLREIHQQDGLVWIDQAGKVQVRNPHNKHGRYPVLVVPHSDAIRVSLNGKRIIGEHVLEESSRLHLRLMVKPPESHISVEVSPDAMEAVLNIQYQAGERRMLTPTTPAVRMELQPRAIPVEAPPITETQIKTALARAGVTEGLVAPEVIRAFLDKRQSGSLIVARGTQPRPGNGSLESFRPEEIDGYWQVETGTIIGRRRPDPARNGTTVHGTILPAPSIRPGNEVRLGPGVTVMTQGTHLVATRDGIVVFGQSIVDVVPQHTMERLSHHNDPVLIDGDLTVRGAVEGCHLVASGNITILGDLRDSTLVAGGAVRVEGFTEEAVVHQGLERTAQALSRQHLERLIDGLYDLELTIDQIRSEVGARLGEVLVRIIPAKFTDVIDAIDQLRQSLRWPGLRWNDEYQTQIHQIYECLQPKALQDPDNLNTLWSLRMELEMHGLDNALTEIPMGRLSQDTVFQAVNRSQIDGFSTLSVESAHSSRITVGTLTAKRSLIGGFTTATQAIHAAQIGAATEIETTIAVTSTDGVIVAQDTYPGVVAVIGNVRQAFQTPLHAMRLTMDTLKGGDNT